MKRIVLIFAICLGLSSCTIAKAAIAMNRSTDHFQIFAGDLRVLYEPGAEAFAKVISSDIDAAIQSVEQKHYREFTKPVVIHLCNSTESFTDYCVISRASGCVLNGRMFLAPKALQPDQQVLTHELSHLHMEQQLGMIAWHSNVPSWFQEGLAVYVSNGEGATTVSIDEAEKSIVQSVSFIPETEGSILFKQTAHSYGLTPNLFYRQASLFVTFLLEKNPSAFKKLLLSISDGMRFEQAFNSAYRSNINTLWKDFVASIS